MATLVVAKLEPGGLSLTEHLGKNLVERFEPLNLEQFDWFERRTYTLNCNWKVFVDNYLDGGYHVPHIHGGLNSVLDLSKYKIETGERFCLQSSPMVTEKGEAETASVRTGDRACYYWIYPNFMINIYEGVMDTNLVVPLAVDRTEVIFDYYLPTCLKPRASAISPVSPSANRFKPRTSPSANPSSAASPHGHTIPVGFLSGAKQENICFTGFSTPT